MDELDDWQDLEGAKGRLKSSGPAVPLRNASTTRTIRLEGLTRNIYAQGNVQHTTNALEIEVQESYPVSKIWEEVNRKISRFPRLILSTDGK